MADFIRMDDITTYPKVIEDAVMSHLPILHSYFGIMQEKTDSQIRCMLDSHLFFLNPELSLLKDRILAELSKHFFEGFHNTRVINKDEIQINGLEILTPKKYLARLSGTFHDLELDKEIIGACILKIQEYLDNKHGNRTNFLALFAPYRLCQDYWKFTKNVGGEICEFALSSRFPDVYSKLALLGYPVTVRFAFPFDTVVSHRKEMIAIEFIRYYCAKHIQSFAYDIGFDCAVTLPIPSRDILEILDFIDMYD